MKKIIAIIPEIILKEKELFSVYSNYTKAIENANGIPIILSYNKDFKLILTKVDKVLLIGGGLYSENIKGKKLLQTNKKRYMFEKDIIDYCILNKIPIMGICRGAQTIAEVLNGKINNSPEKETITEHSDTTHNIEIIKPSFLFDCIHKEKLIVNSHHKKIIEILPEKIKITAISDDGIIEAFESYNKTIIGFQFHPERLSSNLRNNIFKRWILINDKIKL